MVTVSKLTTATEGNLEDLQRLIQQLREDPAEHTVPLTDLQDVISNKYADLIVAKDGERIVGMATLYVIHKLGKRTGYVEDVVVDEKYRGQKIGEQVLRFLIDTARQKQIRTLFLTSRPEREAANKLYQKLGFEVKKTNPYRLKL